MDGAVTIQADSHETVINEPLLISSVLFAAAINANSNSAAKIAIRVEARVLISNWNS